MKQIKEQLKSIKYENEKTKSDLEEVLLINRSIYVDTLLIKTYNDNDIDKLKCIINKIIIDKISKMKNIRKKRKLY